MMPNDFAGANFFEPPLPQNVPTAASATAEQTKQPRPRRGRPPKAAKPTEPQQPMPSVANLRGAMSVLSAAEVADFRPILIDFWRGSGESFDKVITNTNARHTESDVWLFKDAELESLADAMLTLGKRSVYVAVATREVVRSWFAIKALMILGPRVGGTVMFYALNGGFTLPWLMTSPDM